MGGYSLRERERGTVLGESRDWEWGRDALSTTHLIEFVVVKSLVLLWKVRWLMSKELLPWPDGQL